MRRFAFDVDDIVEFERRLAEHGVPLDDLMRRAGAALADAALAVMLLRGADGGCSGDADVGAGIDADVGARVDDGDEGSSGSSIDGSIDNGAEGRSGSGSFEGGCTGEGGSDSCEGGDWRDDQDSLDLSGVCGACSLSECAMRQGCGVGFPYPRPRVLVLAGSGNNGGDGWVAADVLLDAGCEVRLVSPCLPEGIRAEPARSEALRVRERVPHSVNPDSDALRGMLFDADVVIDAMLGIGFAGSALREPFATWALLVNEARSHGVRVISADVPSGMSAQSGSRAHPCVRADVTVTMIACKVGLLAPSAASYVGELICTNLGIDMREYAHLIPNLRPWHELEEYLELMYDPAVADECSIVQDLVADLDGRGATSSELPDEPSAFEQRALSAPAFSSMCEPFSAPAPSAASESAVFAADSAPDAVFGFSYQQGLSDLLEELDAPFSVLIMELIDERGMTDVEVYKRAGMSRQLFSKIRSAVDYRPAKRTVVALAVALMLSLEDTQMLLARAGFTLSHSSKADVIVEYFIVNGIYDVMAINEALYAYDQPLL